MSSKHKTRAINNLYKFYSHYIFVCFLVGIFSSGISVFFISRKDIPNNWILAGLPLPILVWFLTQYLDYEKIKGEITGEIDILEEGLHRQEDIDLLNDQIKKMEESDGSQIRNKQLVFNLVRLNQAAADRSEHMISNDPFLQKHQYSEENFMSKAETKYADAERTKKLCAVIKIISKKSWNQLATNAALKALNPSEVSEVDVKKLDSDPEKLLRLDIYVYLCAWLVNSIDNIAMGMKPMPVNYIKLRYLTPEQSPDIEKYENAFLYLIQCFDMGTLCEIIEQDFSPEQIEICKGVSPHLNTLIEMLKDFNTR